MDSQQVDLSNSITTSVKLDQELKNNASKLAKRKGITFTELIRRLLEDALEKDSLPGYQQIITTMDEHLRKNSNFDENYNTLNKFIMGACNDALNAIKCPHCGTLNSPDSKYCKRCATLLKWESPDKEKAEAFFDYYTRNKPLDNEHEYYLSPPAYNSPDCPFTILIRKIGTNDFKMAKVIEKGDLNLAEMILYEDSHI